MPSREERRWQHYHADKDMRRVRKQIKRNRKPKQVRRKDWMPESFDDLEEFEVLPPSERVMPRGEQERRQAVMAEALANLEVETGPEEEYLVPWEEKREQGVVTEVSSSLCRVNLGERSLVCGIRGSLSAEETGFTNVVAVGDEVLVSEDGTDQGVVESILSRRSVLARAEVYGKDGYRTRDRHRQQVIAANADQVLIVASWREPHLWPELIDRYLITAERNNLASVICVNKIDLAADVTACRRELRPYVDLGYRVIFTSAVTGTGVEELRDLLRERTTVLAGMSGVGKSSLLTAVEPGLELRTREVSERSGEGRHTTTQVNMLKLETGGFVIDTPGIREFGLSGLHRDELIRFYPEIAALEGCRFSNCSHTHEPGCAVKPAVEQGLISAIRYHSYKKIHHDLP